MARTVLVGILAMILAACGQGPTPSSPPAAIASLPASTPAAVPTPVASAAPSADATESATQADLRWTPLPGLDLRGAVVSGGAVSGPTTVLVGADTKTGALASWTSTDGGHWQRHWLDGEAFGGGLPQAIIAGGPGFVALGSMVDAGLGLSPVVWTSPNGVDWSRDPDPSGTFDANLTTAATAATPTSLVVATCCGDSEGPSLRTSSDGIVWTRSTPPDVAHAGPFRLAAAGGSYLAVASVDVPNAEGTSVLQAWRSADGRTWTRDAALEKGLSSVSGVDAVLGSGDRFIIDDDSGAFHQIADDGSLTRVATPAEYGVPTGGPAGLVWLGTADGVACTSAWVHSPGQWQLLRPSGGDCASPARNDGAIALPDGWIAVAPGKGSSGDSAWAIRPQASVVLAAAPSDPQAVPPASAIPLLPTGKLAAHAGCPAKPVTVAKVLRLDANDRIACFGSRPLTLRAWVADPGEGYGGTCDPIEPRWLQVCVLADWLLAPTKGGHTLDGLKAPGAKGELKGVGRWVNVTGHFDDPASASCHHAAGPATVGQPPVGWFVLRCRQQFVVTRIKTTH